MSSTAPSEEKNGLSVCITHFNRPTHLEASLRSLSAQTLLPNEVIIADDASKEDPGPIVEKYENKFPRVIYLRNEKNLGMPENLNCALSKATYSLIANLHDADLYHPDLLAQWVALMAKNADVGFAFCGYDGEDKGGRIWVHQDIDEITEGRSFFVKHFLRKNSSKVWGTVICRKKIYDKLLPFKREFGPWADVDMWMRICADYKVGYVAQPLIVLDNGESHFRKFDWRPFVYLYVMKAQNIRTQIHPHQVNQIMRREQRALVRRLARISLGRILRRQYVDAYYGVKIIAMTLKSNWNESLMLETANSIRVAKST